MTQKNNTKSTSSEIETNNIIQNIQVSFPIKLNFYKYYKVRTLRMLPSSYLLFKRELVREISKTNLRFNVAKIAAIAVEKWTNSSTKSKEYYKNCSRDIYDFNNYTNKPLTYQIVKF
ncbi:hypothetical protein C1645_784560 [Glomus cerebriforme]|uniref:HMG box domain-containing protein n=1 Tax=Glomus cerebriforme TaxID=658196 RepID=A0A397SN10_9GLOM|nr:hypothetical protein C1645_784560 [Glomus cerebriforme]